MRKKKRVEDFIKNITKDEMDKLKQKFYEDMIIYGNCIASVSFDKKKGKVNIERINPTNIYSKNSKSVIK